jgi:hypothetical protein
MATAFGATRCDFYTATAGTCQYLKTLRPHRSVLLTL